MMLTSWINLGRRGARAELSTLDTAHNPPPPTLQQPGKGHPQANKDPYPPQEPPTTTPGPQKRPQMAITDHVQSRNHKQSATEAHQQHPKAF